MTNETKQAVHTPGPWRPVYQPESDLVAHWDIFTPEGNNLACLPETTAEADARLMAAAPELMTSLVWALGVAEALQTVSAARGMTLPPEFYNDRDAAIAAIAKATGV